MKDVHKTLIKKHNQYLSPQTLQDTYVWPVLGSEAKFEEEAIECGLVPEQDYFQTDIGYFIHTPPLVRLADYLIDKYQMMESLDEDLVFDNNVINMKKAFAELGMNSDFMIATGLKDGHFIQGDNGKLLLTEKGIKTGMYVGKTASKR